MAHSKNTIPRRAEAYAAGQVRTGGHHIGDHGPLATGWRAGYNAALRDARKLLALADADGDSNDEKLTTVQDWLAPRRTR